MVATIKGQFLEQGTFNRKTGETVAYSAVMITTLLALMILHGVTKLIVL